MCHHLIPETTRFCNPDKLSMDGMGCKSFRFTMNFCCKNLSLRILSFNGLVELHLFDLLMNMEMLEIHIVHPHITGGLLKSVASIHTHMLGVGSNGE